jgi:hypothetical protein
MHRPKYLHFKEKHPNLPFWKIFMIVSNPRNENSLVDDYNSSRGFSNKGGRSSLPGKTSVISSQMQSAEMVIMEEGEAQEIEREIEREMEDNKADGENIDTDAETGNAENVTDNEDSEHTGKDSKRAPSESSEGSRPQAVRVSMTGEVS